MTRFSSSATTYRNVLSPAWRKAACRGPTPRSNSYDSCCRSFSGQTGQTNPLMRDNNSGTHQLSVLQGLLVHLEDPEEVGAQVGEDEEVAGGIEDGLVRTGLGLGILAALGRLREGLGAEGPNVGRVADVVGVDAASCTADGVLRDKKGRNLDEEGGEQLLTSRPQPGHGRPCRRGRCSRDRPGSRPSSGGRARCRCRW